MMHVIVGENASGKTVFLRKKVKELPHSVNNLIDDIFAHKRQFVRERLELLADYLVADSIDTVGQGDINIINAYVPYTMEFKQAALMMCKEGDYLVLDEPDAKLSKVDGNMMYRFMRILIPTYKECYVATHRVCLVGEDLCTCYKIDKSFSEVQITDDEAWTYVD